MADGGIDPSDLFNFVNRFEQQKWQRCPSSSSSAAVGSVQYAQSEEMWDWQLTSPPEPLSPSSSEARSCSTRTHTTRPSTGWTSHRQHGRPISTASVATWRTEDPPRNEIPFDEWGAFHNTTPHPTPHPTPTVAVFSCEFKAYQECERSFAVTEKQEWIDHTVWHFDRIGLPYICLCWYCDKYQFNADRENGDTRMNFEYRMRHISGHFPQLSAHREEPKKRLDPWILDHLWENGQISVDVYNRERTRHEMPQIEGLLNVGELSPVQSRRAYQNSYEHHDTQAEDRHRRRRR
jgi:hypothetical protein